MRRKSLLFLTAAFLCAICASANDSALPADPADWPGKLDMTAKMLFLVLQIGIIIFAAKLGGSLASLFRLPSVLGELGAGIAIGPWALGGIPIPGFGGMFKYGLFCGEALRAQAAAGASPFAATPELYGVCTIASVVLLFLSGLETNLKMFLKFAFAGSLVGVGGVVFSFVFGDLLAVYATTLFPGALGGIGCLADLGAMVERGEIVKAVLSPSALFMGIMSTATSVGITARILSERKKMDTEEGVTIMAGAVIDDVLGIIVLAIGMGIIGSQHASGAAANGAGVHWGAIGKVALQAFGVWLAGTVLGILFARCISWLLKLLKSPVAIATLAFGLSLVIAGVFEALGLTLIIGAYVMGLALSRTDIKHLVQENLQAVYTFFVPIFFCVMGMMVDCSALCSKQVLVFGAVYTVFAVAAKILGCAFPAMFCGFNVLGALRIGAGMIPRGEVALIIAGIGLSNGYLTQEVFGIGILMTLVTTVIAPPALVGLFSFSRRGVRRPKDSMTGSRQVIFALPDAQVAEIMAGKLVEEFRKEGFFTVRLSHEISSEIWQVSLGSAEMSLVRNDREIKVECTPDEEAFVRQAWMEVVSQMNELAHIIAVPVQERGTMEKLITQVDDSSDTSSSVARTLRGFAMIPALHANSKREAIETLVEAVAAANPKHVRDVDRVKAAVFAREDSMPTGLDRGIAVPHGRTDAVDEILGAVAIVDNTTNENGSIADYETIDHSAVQIIVLTVAPETAQTPYLQLMAAVSKMLRSDGLDDLLACKTEEAMRAFFKKA